MMTERRRCFLLFETGIPPMTNHHAIDNIVLGSSRTVAYKSAKDCEFFAIQLFTGAIDFRQTMMRIDDGSRIAWKMFPAACYPRNTQRAIERSRVPDYLLDRFSVTATTQGIVRLVIKRNIEHGTEIEIETEQSQQVSGDVGVLANQLGVFFVVQLCSCRRFVLSLK